MFPLPFQLGQLSSLVRNGISDSRPFFLSRIGGSDTNALVDFLALPRGDDSSLERHLNVHLPIVKRYNGFYSFRDQKADYLDYLDLIKGIYLSSPLSMVGGFQLLSIMFPDSINPVFVRNEFENKDAYIRLIQELFSSASPKRAYYPYGYVERFLQGEFNLLRDLEASLSGKRVLVVSPFSESIQSNFSRRFEFFKDYSYPDFDMVPLATPITYSGLPREFYPHETWEDTVESLKQQLRNLNFDIALMSCGSYALPLGECISAELGRSAIYVGGILQLFFGVMGRRYEGNTALLNQLNTDKFIYPLEKQKFLPFMNVQEVSAAEAFGAYF